MSTRVLRTPPGVAVRAFVAAVAFLLGISAEAADKADRDGPKTPALDRIFANWKARQERTKSFHFAWDSRIVFPKGAENPLRRPAQGGQAILDQDQQYNLPRSEFWVDRENRLCVEYSLLTDQGPTAVDPRSRYRSSFDGEIDVSVNTSSSSRDAPRATIWNEDRLDRPKRFHDINKFAVKPLLLTFRPFLLNPALRPASCQLSSEDAVVDGRRCVLFEQVHKASRIVDSYWVDPERDDVVVQWKSQSETRSDFRLRMSIEYKTDGVHGWIPSQWTLEVLRRVSGPQEITHAKVTSYTINEKLAEEIFAPKIPNHAIVFERAAGRHYFLRNDGSKRPITAEDLRNDLKYADFVKEDRTQIGARN